MGLKQKKSLGFGEGVRQLADLLRAERNVSEYGRQTDQNIAINHGIVLQTKSCQQEILIDASVDEKEVSRTTGDKFKQIGLLFRRQSSEPQHDRFQELMEVLYLFVLAGEEMFEGVFQLLEIDLQIHLKVEDAEKSI